MLLNWNSRTRLTGIYQQQTTRYIQSNIQRLYGKPTIQELYQALLGLNNPMERDQPIEVMLKSMEEIQTFLMAHPDGDQELSKVNSIPYGSIKLPKYKGLYSKGIERWQAKPTHHTTKRCGPTSASTSSPNMNAY